MDDAESKIIGELSSVKPAKVRLYLPDGQTKDLLVPARAGRWNIVAGIMASLPWDRAELVDKSGATVGVINMEPAPGSKAPPPEEPKEIQLLRILKEAQGMVFSEMRDTFGRVFDAMAGVMETTTARLNALEVAQQTMIERERKHVRETAAATGEDGEGRSVADDLMLTVGKGLVNKFMGGGVNLGQIKDLIGKMDPQQVKSFLDQLGMGGSDATEDVGSDGGTDGEA